MKETNYNINVKARVELTRNGATILNEYFRMLGSLTSSITSFKTDYKEGETYTSELWSIMQIFGPKIGMGGEIPFVNNQITILQ